MTREQVIIQEQLVWEFAGEYPEVPTTDGVDMATLTRGDDEPFFVTLPIGKAGVVSGNNTYYGDTFQRELTQQVLEKRPTGIMGHIPDYERSTSFPLPAVHWVGATQDTGMTWGKAYVPPGSVREFVRRLKATGSKIATSIYGTANREWDEALSAWTLSEFELETIDLAPPERAGIRDLAVIPKVTAEMAGQETPAPAESEDEVDRDQVIRELTADDVRAIPEGVVRAIRESAPEIAQVREMRQALALDDAADVVQAVREMAETARQQARQAVENRIAELAGQHVQADDEAGSVRAMVTELVRAAQPATVQEVDDVFSATLEKPHVKALLQMTVLQEMGDPLRNPAGRKPQGDDGENPFISVPKVD